MGVIGGDWTAQPDTATASAITKPVDDKFAVDASLIRCLFLMRERDTILFAFDKPEDSVCTTATQITKVFLSSAGSTREPIKLLINPVFSARSEPLSLIT
jgi:hypothetical protein